VQVDTKLRPKRVGAESNSARAARVFLRRNSPKASAGLRCRCLKHFFGHFMGKQSV